MRGDMGSNSRWRHAAAVAIFLAATLIWSWPLPSRMGASVPRDFGDPLLVLHLMDWDRHALTKDTARLWDGDFYYPNVRVSAFTEPFVGQALLGWPVELATGSAIASYNAVLLMELLGAAIAAYALAVALGASFGGAIVSGLIWGFGPFRYAQILHLHIESSLFFPLVLLACVLALKRRSFGALLGMAGAIVGQFLFSPQLGVFAFYLAAAFWLWAAVTGQLTGAMAARVGVALTVAAAAIVPLAWPYLDAKRMYGWHWTQQEQRELSADLTEFFLAPGYSRLWSFLPAAIRNPWGEDHENGTGWFASGIALAGLLLWRRPALEDRAAKFLPWLFAFGIVVALGPRLHVAGHEVSLGQLHLFGHTQTLHVNLPMQWLGPVLPGFSGIRAISRFGLLAVLAVALLAGLSLTAAGSWLARFGERKARWAVAAGITACVAELYGGRLLLVEPPQGDPGEAVYRFLKGATAPGAVLELPLPYEDKDPTSPGHDALYLWRQRLHGRPVLNGYSAHKPPDYGALCRMGPRFPDAASLAFFRSRGARFVVVHVGMRAGVSSDPARLDPDAISRIPVVFHEGNDWVFDLSPSDR